MAEIREKTAIDDVAAIVALATEDLRRVYRRASRVDGSVTPEDENTAMSLVAVEGGIVVGIVEYREKAESLYVRGLAVHPQKRRRGIAKALVREVETIAARKGKPQVTLSTIKETGNLEIFGQLGYSVINEAPATGFEGFDGGTVTKVDMCRMLG